MPSRGSRRHESASPSASRSAFPSVAQSASQLAARSAARSANRPVWRGLSHLGSAFVSIALVAAGQRAEAGAQLEVPVQYPSVQAAVDAAVDGDSILIAPGTYEGGIVIDGKSITLLGSPGAALVGGGSIGSVLLIRNATGVTLSGLEFSGGIGSESETKCWPFGPTRFGGGVRVDASEVVVDDCRFLQNEATLGGGLWYEAGSSVVVRDSLFEGNRASEVSSALGGCWYGLDNDLLVEDSEFRGNVEGGVIFVYGTLVPGRGDAILRGVLFEANAGLGILMTPGSNPIELLVEDTVFRLNDRPASSIFVGGSTAGNSVTIDGCLVEDDFSSIGGGPAAIFATIGPETDFVVRDSIVRRAPGIAITVVALGGGTIAVEDCELEDTDGGILLSLDGADAVVRRTEILRPSNEGLYAILNDGSIEVANTLVAQSLLSGVTIIADGPDAPNNSARLANVTVTQNAFVGVNLNRAELGSFVVANSIVAGNGALELLDNPLTPPSIDFTMIPGGFPGEGNLDALPLFVDGAFGDFRLAPSSPGVDAGSNLLLAGVGDLDAAGAPRLVDAPDVPDSGVGPAPIVDLGAYEVQNDARFGDLDGDGRVGAADLALLLGSWGPCAGPGGCAADLDGDGQVDAADLAALLGAWSA